MNYSAKIGPGVVIHTSHFMTTVSCVTKLMGRIRRHKGTRTERTRYKPASGQKTGTAVALHADCVSLRPLLHAAAPFLCDRQSVSLFWPQT
jgi:hypothetical protein